MSDPHYRPSPYRPSSPSGSWLATGSSTVSLGPPERYQPGATMGEQGMDPYYQHYQYQQSLEHQHAHFYRQQQQQPTSVASNSGSSSASSPYDSTVGWGTPLIDPHSLHQLEAHPGPSSSAWDPQRGAALAAVGNGSNAAPTTSWEPFTVGHALAGLAAGCE
jgi:hypothetical protein